MLRGRARNGSRRVVVTGLGVVSPVGHTCLTFWDALTRGRSGVRRRGEAAMPYAGEAVEFRGRIEDFGTLEPDTAKAIRKALKLMNRETQMAVAAGQQALTESGLVRSGIDLERVGICFGADNVSMMPEDFVAGVRACSTPGGEFDFDQWGSKGLAEVAPLWLLKCLPNMPACYLAMFNGFRGPNNSITSGSVSANLAIAESVRLIQDGDADAILTGATGTRLHPFNYIHASDDEPFAIGDADPASICRPFDRDRAGAVPGEGAAAFVLESLDRARERGATIYAEILATSSVNVVDRAGRPQRREALVEALRACLAESDLDPDGVDHLHAHGLSTPAIDAEEAQAVRDVFGGAADTLPVMAIKSNIGNAGAGAGALEFAASLLALRQDQLIPVLNFTTRDPNCPVMPVTRGAAAGTSFVSVSVAADGQASCVAAEAFAWN